MNLKYLIDQIDPVVEECGEYRVYVLEEISQGKYQEHSVIKIDIEDDAGEINLVTNQYAKEQNNDDGILLSSLCAQLKLLPPHYADCAVYSRTAEVYVDEECRLIRDAPLVAIGWNHDHRRFGLVQERAKK